MLTWGFPWIFQWGYQRIFSGWWAKRVPLRIDTRTTWDGLFSLIRTLDFLDLGLPGKPIPSVVQTFTTRRPWKAMNWSKLQDGRKHPSFVACSVACMHLQAASWCGYQNSQNGDASAWDFNHGGISARWYQLSLSSADCLGKSSKYQVAEGNSCGKPNR